MKLTKEHIGKEVVNEQGTKCKIVFIYDSGSAAVIHSDGSPGIIEEDEWHFWEYYKEEPKLVEKTVYAPVYDVNKVSSKDQPSKYPYSIDFSLITNHLPKKKSCEEYVDDFVGYAEIKVWVKE